MPAPPKFVFKRRQNVEAVDLQKFRDDVAMTTRNFLRLLHYIHLFTCRLLLQPKVIGHR